MNALHALLTCLQEYQFRLFWAELLFMLYLPRRSKYPLRLLVWLPFLFLPLLFGNAFDADFFRIGSYTWSFLAWFAYSLFAVAFCHKTDAGTFVFVAVSAYALQNLFADFRYFMLLPGSAKIRCCTAPQDYCCWLSSMRRRTCCSCAPGRRS